MWNRIWDFTSVSAFDKTFLSLHQTPHYSLSYWPSVSVTVTTQLKQLSTRYVRQYSTVSNSKGNNIIFNMTVLCDEEETNTFEVSNEWSERNSQNNITVCTITMFLQSDKCNIQLSCAHHDGIWERGGTAANIINPVLLHTVWSDNILATIWSVNLPFSPQHFIRYRMEQVTLSLITYLDIRIFMGYWILA